jgi:hypothetical protein
MRSKNFHLIPEAIARKGYLILDGFSEQRARELYRALAANRTYLVPTLVTGRALTFVDELSVEEDPRAKYVPAHVREWWKPEKGMLTRYRTPAPKRRPRRAAPRGRADGDHQNRKELRPSA